VYGEIAEYYEAIRLKPDDASFHVALGSALCQNEDWDGGIAEFRTALRLSPDDAGVHYALGAALELKMDLQGALREYRAACELDPQRPKYRQAYERVLQQLNR
jgi:Flp pilus assembly protein TadD